MGTSKKQQRIADIVKAQLREELVEVLEARLEQLAAGKRRRQRAWRAGAAASAGGSCSMLGADTPGVQQLLQHAQGGEPQAELRALADLASLAHGAWRRWAG